MGYKIKVDILRDAHPFLKLRKFKVDRKRRVVAGRGADRDRVWWDLHTQQELALVRQRLEVRAESQALEQPLVAVVQTREPGVFDRRVLQRRGIREQRADERRELERRRRLGLVHRALHDRPVQRSVPLNVGLLQDSRHVHRVGSAHFAATLQDADTRDIGVDGLVPHEIVYEPRDRLAHLLRDAALGGTQTNLDQDVAHVI